MKPDYSFFRIFTALLLFTTVFHHNFLLGQTLDDSKYSLVFKRTPKKICFRCIVKTTDWLFINRPTRFRMDKTPIAKSPGYKKKHGDKIFWMDKTPLEKFPGYKKIYEDKVEPYGNYAPLSEGLVDPDPTTNYMVVWYLNDSLLYLSDIYPNLSSDKVEETFPDDELYKRMEKLTGIKFDRAYENHSRYMYEEHKNDRSVRDYLYNPLGAMPATWFSDTILVRTEREMDIHYWYKIPPLCRELIFKGGKLISERIREDIN
ncbi:MAG: hypothetical protein LBS52_03025 [Dysgonamonadaceae bacterium]|jgi:hypothetical protein|nr:hypothetical protein [Dysgonamonadaceae bacterium]